MTENAFYSLRSLWQLIAGGVFDGFPNLKMAYIETQLMFLIPAIANLDMILGADNDVMGFARVMNRERSVQRLASEYFQTNIFVGESPSNFQSIVSRTSLRSLCRYSFAKLSITGSNPATNPELAATPSQVQRGQHCLTPH